MAVNRRKHEGSQTVTKSAKHPNYGEAEIKNQTGKIPVDNLQDVANPARVRVEASATKNIGNYESVRVGVMIDMPCAPTTKAVDQMYKYLSQRVYDLTCEEIDAIPNGEYTKPMN